MAGSSVATERHYSVDEVAEMWSLHRSKVRRMFIDVDGVLKIGRNKYLTLRIPESVLERFYAERTRAFTLKIQSRRRAV